MKGGAPLKVAAKVSTAAIELVWHLSNNHDVRVEFIVQMTIVENDWNFFASQPTANCLPKTEPEIPNFLRKNPKNQKAAAKLKRQKNNNNEKYKQNLCIL